MMATMGYITPEVIGKLPGYLSPSAGLKFADIPNGLAAVSKVPTAGWAQIAAYFGFVEFAGGFTDYKTGTPGDYGFKVLTSSDPAEKTKKLAAEIANGRLAMVAIIGMFFQDGLTGSAWGDWALYTASPLRAFENELGVQAPVGFFDPLGLSKNGDTDAFMRRRSTEFKHGRIAMLACMGYITPEITGKFPGYLSYSAGIKFEDVPNGLAAISKVPFGGWMQILAYMSFCENSRLDNVGSTGWGTDIKLGKPGDFGFKVITSDDPDTVTKKLNSELANGRLAMMAIIGMFFQDGLTGSAWGDWSLYTSSPLRAKVTRNYYGGDAGTAARVAFDPANELGVQDPVGFWDPLGFAADKDEATFKRRRAVEIKHGRISMYATIGYIVPEYFKFPGFLSPSLGLKFADVPNGLCALSKLPLLGGAQMIAFAGLIETTGFFQAESTTDGRGPREGAFAMMDSTETGEPGNYGVGFPNFLGKVDDPEARKTKLAAELANGRLAMMAIIGMFFQDGLTGSAWGDWALYTASPLR